MKVNLIIDGIEQDIGKFLIINVTNPQAASMAAVSAYNEMSLILNQHDHGLMEHVLEQGNMQWYVLVQHSEGVNEYGPMKHQFAVAMYNEINGRWPGTVKVEGR